MAFWKPGTAAPGIDLDRDSEEDRGQGALPYIYNKYGNLSLQQQRANLPIFRFSKSHRYHFIVFYIIYSLQRRKSFMRQKSTP